MKPPLTRLLARLRPRARWQAPIPLNTPSLRKESGGGIESSATVQLVPAGQVTWGKDGAASPADSVLSAAAGPTVAEAAAAAASTSEKRALAPNAQTGSKPGGVAAWAKLGASGGGGGSGDEDHASSSTAAR